MKITDHAYIMRMRDVVFRPALTAMEAAMLPARLPRGMGALAHAKQREEACWGALGFTDRKSGSGKRSPWR